MGLFFVRQKKHTFKLNLKYPCQRPEQIRQDLCNGFVRQRDFCCAIITVTPSHTGSHWVTLGHAASVQHTHTLRGQCAAHSRDTSTVHVAGRTTTAATLLGHHHGHAGSRCQCATHAYIARPVCRSIQRRKCCACGWPDHNSGRAP